MHGLINFDTGVWCTKVKLSDKSLGNPIIALPPCVGGKFWTSAYIPAQACGAVCLGHDCRVKYHQLDLAV